MSSPTLLGLHAAAPYLHDGSAATETDGTFTFSYVRHHTQTAYDYIALTSGDLTIWGDIENPTTSYRPSSITTSPLDATYEIWHLHFDPRAQPGFFRVKIEIAD